MNLSDMSITQDILITSHVKYVINISLLNETHLDSIDLSDLVCLFCTHLSVLSTHTHIFITYLAVQCCAKPCRGTAAQTEESGASSCLSFSS